LPVVVKLRGWAAGDATVDDLPRPSVGLVRVVVAVKDTSLVRPNGLSRCFLHTLATVRAGRRRSMLRTMIRQVAYGFLGLVFGWQAIVFLAPVVLALARHEAATGDLGLGVGIIAVGLACLAAAAWCFGQSSKAGRLGRPDQR